MDCECAWQKWVNMNTQVHMNIRFLAFINI